MNTHFASVAQEPSSRIYFNEVVTRDGFQNESVFIETDDKVALIDALSECGYAKIEVTSFTSAKAIPMLRDAEAVMQRVRRVAGVEYSVLVPNVRGAERALECRPDELNLVMSCSESHNLANLRMARPQSLQTLLDVVRHVQQAKPVHPVAINVSLSCVFGCPIEGAVPLAVVQQLVQTFVDEGVRGITLCDTTGMAHPAQVQRVCDWALQAHPQLQVTLHFHNTRGMGLANVLAAVQSGVRRFDGSLGGLGGCPYAPGATGNICSEDALHMLQAMGFDTGVSLPRLLPLARALPDLVGHALSGQVAKAGVTEDLHPMPCNP
jgi:hydroxymethylglutaryl-CoA lyase